MSNASQRTKEANIRARALLDGKCPRCGWWMVAGPRGGLAQNMYCENRTHCRNGFNVVIYHGMLIWEHDIGEVDDESFAMYSEGGFNADRRGNPPRS